MSLLDWSSAYSISNDEIDQQHMKLVDVLNQLHNSMHESGSKEAVAESLNALAEYTKYHFTSEEKMFQQTSYPKIEEHKQEHRDFVAKIEEWQEEYKEGRMLLNVDMLDYLVTWTLNHIKKVDIEMGKWL